MQPKIAVGKNIKINLYVICPGHFCKLKINFPSTFLTLKGIKRTEMRTGVSSLSRTFQGDHVAEGLQSPPRAIPAFSE